MSEEPYTPTTDDVRAELAAIIEGNTNHTDGDWDALDVADAILASDWFAAEIAKAQADAVTEAAIIEWMGRHSSAAISRVLHHGHDTLDTRFADGVFE